MAESIHDLDAMIASLKQQRDTIKLRIHLAKADLREEWDDLEKQWEHLQVKANALGREAQAASREVFAAAKLLAEEIRRGYERVRKQLR
jgi:hypothetical protein